MLVDENVSQFMFFRHLLNVFNAVGVKVETDLFRFVLNFQIWFQRWLKCREFIHRHVTFFSFPCYHFVIICFNQANCVTSHPLLRVPSHLGSEFCFGRFCTSILRNFCRSHAEPCVCVHACVYVFRQHTNN